TRPPSRGSIGRRRRRRDLAAASSRACSKSASNLDIRRLGCRPRGMGSQPDWFQAGLSRVWLPYAQMKTEPPPLPVVSAHGSRLVLADGRELIDGVASWWTASHGYGHPHIIQAVQRQLQSMPHVMFG